MSVGLLRRPSSTVTVRGRPSPEKLLRVFYSPKLWVCREAKAFPCVGCPSWRHFPRAWDPLVDFAGTCWGGVDSAHLKTNEDAFGVCFLFVLSVLCIKHRALLNAPRFDMAPSSVMGCLAQGMCICGPFLSARSAWSCRQQLRLRLEILWRAQRLQFQNRDSSPVFALLFMRIFATIENCSRLVGPLLRRGTPAQHFSFLLRRSHIIWFLL